MSAYVFIFFIFFSFSFGFEKCLDMFRSQMYLSAYKCFSKIDAKDPLYPDSVYYRVLSADIMDLKIDIPKDFEKFKNTAIYSYTYLYLSSKYRFTHIKKSYDYLKKVDPQALSQDDIPFFYYLKMDLLKRLGKNEHIKLIKEISTKFPYDRTYGYPVVLENLKILNDKQISKTIEKLVSKRMYKRALKIANHIRSSELKNHYLSVIYGRLRKFDEAFRYLLKVKNKEKTAYILIRLNPSYDIQEALFAIIKNSKNTSIVEKSAHYMMKRAFYRRKYDDFMFYSKFIKKGSPYYSDRIWFRFLYLYKTGEKLKAANILEKNIKWFSDKGRVYYWLYLSYREINRKKSSHYLKKTADLNSSSFYSLRAREKLGRKLFKISDPDTPTLTKDLIRIKKLKKIDYSWAYIEGSYYIKKNKNISGLSAVMPEITARYFKNISYLSYPKPYRKYAEEDIVYAIMRRESLFNPYAISPSNAIGLMQIIPPTGRWIAQKIGVKNFDLTDLFDPYTNIKFGKWYIKHLKDLFKGNLFYTIAAYNCGPYNVKKVLKSNKIKNVEEFIEFIPFRETRYYVKYVYKNILAYKTLYRGR